MTDPKRLRKFQKIMADAANRDDVDDDAYKEFLASHTESEASEAEEMDKDKIEEYRRKLLGGLSTSNDDARKSNLQVEEDSDEDKLDIKFNVGFGEDVGKKILTHKKQKKEEHDETAWESYQRKRKEKKKDKKHKAKEHKNQIKKQGQLNPEEIEQSKRKTAELELLIGKKNNGNIEGDFKANTKDKRFEAVLKDKSFAIDPTHKNFRKVADGEYIKK